MVKDPKRSRIPIGMFSVPARTVGAEFSGEGDRLTLPGPNQAARKDALGVAGEKQAERSER